MNKTNIRCEYCFQVSPQTLFERTLRILVYNIDVNRKHRIVGVSHLELKDVDLSQGKLVIKDFNLSLVDFFEIKNIILSQ